MKRDNPFNHNYVFSEFDIKRSTINWKDMLWLWIYPTYVQVGDGYAFHFKNVNGRLYLMKTEALNGEENRRHDEKRAS